MSINSTLTCITFNDILDPIFEYYKWTPFTFKEAQEISPKYTMSLHKRCICNDVIKAVGYKKRTDTFKYYRFTANPEPLRKYNPPIICSNNLFKKNYINKDNSKRKHTQLLS